MTRRPASLDELTDSLAKYPWWACIAAALVTFLALHAASLPPPPASSPTIETVVPSLWVTAAGISKWIVPIPLLFMAAASVWSRNRGIALHEAIAQDGGLAALRAMSWQAWLPLLAEAFRAEGFAVEQGVGAEDESAHATTGADLILTAGAGTWCVLARQWRAPSVGVEQVAALHAAMQEQGASAGVLVATGHLLREAVEAAEALNIEVLGGEDLLRRVRRVRQVRGGASTGGAGAP